MFTSLTTKIPLRNNAFYDGLLTSLMIQKHSYEIPISLKEKKKFDNQHHWNLACLHILGMLKEPCAYFCSHHY
jgi:hypothetical protein